MGVKKEIVKGLSYETFNMDEVFAAYNEFRGFVNECNLNKSFSDSHDRLTSLYNNVFKKLKIPQTRHNTSVSQKYLGFQQKSPPSIDNILLEDLDPFPCGDDLQDSNRFKIFLNEYMKKRGNLHFYDITALLGGRVDWYYHQILVVLWLYNQWDFDKVKARLSDRNFAENTVNILNQILFELFGKSYLE